MCSHLMLAEVLTKEDNLAILTGAEIFDGRKHAISCMQTELLMLMQKLEGRKIHFFTYLLSFGFKKSNRKLLENVDFIKDHLEDMDPLFNNIDRVITEAEIIK